MKRSLLMLILVSLPCFGQTLATPQVPAHSVVNGVTVDIVDTQLPVPYGPAETRAMVSACVADQPTRIQFNVYYAADQVDFYVDLYTAVKTDSGYCGVAVAPVPLAKITSIQIDTARSTGVIAPISGSKAESQRAPFARPR